MTSDQQGPERDLRNSAFTVAPGERHIAAAIWAVISLGTVKFWLEPGKTVFDIAFLVVVGLGATVLSVLTVQRSSRFDEHGGVDIASLRSRTFRWKDIAAVYVGRPGGLLEGFCIVMGTYEGQEINLLGTRTYSRSAAAVRYEELRVLARRLEVLRAAAHARDPG